MGGLAAIVHCLGGIGPSAASCASVGFPSDAGVVDVRRFGAKGDGITDDTAAIQRSLSNAMPPGVGASPRGVQRIVYLPDGTYLVRDTLKWRTSYERYLVLQGQSRSKTIIKLADKAPGFGDRSRPRAVVSTRRSAPDLRDSFRNGIYDITIDAGRFNPGAIGVDFITNNTGGMRNVVVRTTDPARRGAVGIRLTQPMVGPGLFKTIVVYGFDIGLETRNDDFNAVFEHLQLSGQRVAGIRNDRFPLTIRDLKSRNSVPVVDNRGEMGLVQIIGGTFEGGAPESEAVRSTGGFVHLRNISSAGYGVIVHDGPRRISGPRLAEYTTGSFEGEGSGSLRLPETEPPDVPCDAISDWSNAARRGAKPNDGGKEVYEGPWTERGDDAAAIQAAIDSGATTVYLPNGVWQIGRTIVLRGNLRRLDFLNSTLQLTRSFASSGEPAFRLLDGAHPAVVLERMETDYGEMRGDFIVHDARRTLILRELALNLKARRGYATGGAGSGDVFFEDVTADRVLVRGQRAWLRQFNPEGTGPAHLVNDGGQVWVLGMKTEGVAPMVETINGGRTEVLGSLLQVTDHVPQDLPAFIVRDSRLSVVAATGIDPAAQQALVIRAEKNGSLREWRSSDFQSRASRVLRRWDGSYGPAGAFWVFATQ
ncbi:MAG: glycoside hydrolase family 55 protein [Hyphomicrobium sp.]|nr:glycoside hydrolase family 55 protein [Hyphomicrobium sp.]